MYWMHAMIDFMGLQRSLFRMQLDPEFSERVLRGEQEALLSTELEGHSLALLRGLDAGAVSADRGGRRGQQLLGNLATEFPASVAVFLQRSKGAGEGLGRFLSSDWFHRAIAESSALPVGFGKWLSEWAQAAGARSTIGLVELECALMNARRTDPEELARVVAAVPPGHLRTSPNASLLELPAGLLDWTQAVNECVQRGDVQRLPRPQLPSGSKPEVVCLLLGEREASGRYAVSVERLQEAVASLLRFLEEPRDRSELEPWAAELGAEPEQLHAFLAELSADGLITGQL